MVLLKSLARTFLISETCVKRLGQNLLAVPLCFLLSGCEAGEQEIKPRIRNVQSHTRARLSETAEHIQREGKDLVEDARSGAREAKTFVRKNSADLALFTTRTVRDAEKTLESAERDIKRLRQHRPGDDRPK